MIIAELICVLAFILVFLILWIGYNDKYHDCPNIVFRFCHDHASDILMAALVAFLATILYVAGALRDDLTNHRKSWENSQRQLESYRQQLSDASDSLGALTVDVQEETKKLGRLAKNMLEIHNLAEKSVNPTALAEIQDKSFEWTEKWAELIFRKNFPMPTAGSPNQQIEQAALEYATSRCLALMYSSYVDQEVSSIPSDRSPMLTTNYPTYLSFLSRLATHFVDSIGHVGNSEIEKELNKYKVCIVTLADILPVGFLMLCRRLPDEKWECEMDKQLLDWRAVSCQLVKMENCFFKRVFITAGYDSDKIFVPKAEQFNDLLGHYIWYPLRDRGLREGFIGGFEDAFQKLGLKGVNCLRYKKNAKGFLISTAKQLPTGINPELAIGTEKIKISESPLSVKDFLMDWVHGKQAASAGQCKIENDDHLAKLGYQEGFPTDMFVIGLIPLNANLEGIEYVDRIKPIMGVACRQVSGLPENICTLRLYFGQQLAGGQQPIWSWVQELLRNAKPIS